MNPARVRVVKACLNDARRAKLLDENPFDGIEKGTKRGRRDITVLTEPVAPQGRAAAESAPHA